MNELTSQLRGNETPQPSDPLPVSQRPESIAFGSLSLLMGSSFVANMVEAANHGLSDFETLGGVSAGIMTGATAYNAVRAHRETAAYNNATEEERNSPHTIDRRRLVRSMRTLSWGGTTFICAEVGIIEAVKAAGAGNAKESLARLGVTAVTALVGTKTASGFRQSWRQQKPLKELSVANRSNETNRSPFVSAEYQGQLGDLASLLVTPERFHKH